jgi:hypothetical protein
LLQKRTWWRLLQKRTWWRLSQKRTWWRLLQKRATCTKLDIYGFILYPYINCWNVTYTGEAFISVELIFTWQNVLFAYIYTLTDKVPLLFFPFYCNN